MSNEEFQAAIGFLWRPENDGQAFHNTRGDAGGATAWGVTFNTWIAWRQLHGVQGPGGTLAEFAALQAEDFLPFYITAFWNAVQGDRLPAGIGLVVFDAAVMSGVSRAGRWLERVLGTSQDGIIGPHDIDAADAAHPSDVIHRFTILRRAFYAGIIENNPDQRRFLNGWYRRAGDCEQAALEQVAQ